MADYKAILYCLSKHNLHHFTFYLQFDKPNKAVIRHLPIKIYSDLQDLSYDVISVKQMTTKCPSPDDSTRISLPLFLVSMARS